MLQRILTILAMCPVALFAQIDEAVDFIRPMDTVINSSYEEIAPIMGPNNMLYFTRALHPGNLGGQKGGEDIWVATLQDGGWASASNEIPRLNDFFNNAVVGVANDGHTLFLLGSYSGKYEFQGGISKSTLTERGWSKPKAQKVKKLNTRSMFNSYFVDASGRIMIIGITNGSGENEDLYVSFWEKKNTWSEPIHLGPQINTAESEFAPFLANPELLYFSSTGREGLGDADIYYSRRLDDSWQNWSEPKNVGSPINSEGFDAYFTRSGGRAFFSSNRKGEFSDIYEIAFVEVEYEEEGPATASKGQTFMLDLVGQAFSEQGMVDEIYLTTLAGDTLETLPVVNGSFRIAKIPDNEDYMLRLPRQNPSALRENTLMLKQNGENIMLYPSVEFNGFLFTLRNAEIAAVMPEEEQVTEFVFDYAALDKEGVTVTLYDENDNPIETVTLETSGRFAFRKLEKDKAYYMKINAEDVNLDAAKLFVMNSNGAMLEMDAATLAKGQPFEMVDESQFKVPAMPDTTAVAQETETGEKFRFDYGKLPVEGMKVHLYDENDNLIETAIVDSQGNFEFKKLNAMGDFYIRTEEEVDLSQMNFYAVGDNGAKVKLDAQTLEGDFAYRKLNEQVFQALAQQETEDTELDYALQEAEAKRFAFTYNNLPVAGTRIGLYDENDNLIEIAIVDSEGYYEFKKLDPARAYYMKIEEEDIDLDQAKLYAVDESGEKQELQTEGENNFAYRKLEAAASGIALEEAADNELDLRQEIAEGTLESRFTFTYSGLPHEMVRISMYDENNMLIGTAIVDSQGYFVFRKLRPDHNYRLKIDAEDIDMSLVQISAVDDAGNTMPLVFASGEGYFTYKSLGADAATTALASVEDTELDIKNEVIKRFAFSYNNLPAEGTRIGLYDENDSLVEIAVVDSKGYYDFKMLDHLENYYVKVEAEDMDLNLVKLYEVDENGERTELELLADGEYFTYNKLLAEGAEDLASQEAKDVDLKARVPKAEPKKTPQHGEPDFRAYYAFNEIYPSGSIRTTLYQALKDLRQDNGLTLLIVGHTDDKGTNEVNQRVGMMRARYAKHYFTSRGIADSRVETATKGETEPIAPNDTDENRAKNRRVEIFVK